MITLSATTPIEDDVRRALGDEIGSLLRLKPAAVTFAPVKNVVQRPDAATVLHVIDFGGVPRAVLLCSAPDRGDMVNRAMSRAALARDMLKAEDAAAILQPLVQGWWNGRSYALLEYCQPLQESSRLRRWIQAKALRPRVLEWLYSVNVSSVKMVSEAAVGDRFVTPLMHLESVPGLNGIVRRDVIVAHDRLMKKEWLPRHVLMHGDLWRGNILIRTRDYSFWRTTLAPRFVVIDWPGSLCNGYPMFDLIRLAASMNIKGQPLQREVMRHVAALALQPEDAMPSLLAALGYISLHLEDFPLPAFLSMAHACHAIMRSVIEH